MKRTLQLLLFMAGLSLASSGVFAQEGWKELIANGNFEGSDFSSFSIYNTKDESTQNLTANDIVVDENDANNHCVKLTFTTRPVYVNINIKLTEPLTEGDLLTFSMRAKTNAAKDATIKTDEAGQFIVKVGGAWNTLSYEGYVSPEIAGRETIALKFTVNTKQTDVFYFDDISVKVKDGSTPIEFADANAKEICVNNWDTNHDGELSLAEAAVVNDLNQVFFCNYDITSFNEFQYFIGLTTIDGRDFYGCSNLTSIIIPNNVTEISPYTGWPSAFQWCGRLASVTLGNKVETIGADSFTGCESLTSIVIPNSVTYIGEGAFSSCSNLTKIYCYPEKIPEIGANAFGNHTNSILHVPANLVEDYSNAELWKDFGSIAALDSSIDGFYYCFNSNDKTAKVASASDDYSGALTIPSAVSYNGENYNVTSIGTSAFYGCSGITSITIPSYISNIGEKAFTGCYGISSIVVDEGNSKYESRDNCNAIIEKMSNTLLMGCKKTVIPDGIKTIGDYAFYNCSGLSSIIIPNSVENIGINAFYGCSDMTFITLGNGLTTIGEGAFTGCSGITSLSIPASVKTIGRYAFFACRGLNAVYITNLEAWCGFNFTVEYANYDNPLAYAQHFYINGEEVKDLIIPETITSVGNYVFNSCPGLTSVTIPNNVENIGEGVFDNCKDLASVTIGNGVKSIGRNAFYNCSALTAVHINDLDAWCKIQFEEYNSANPLNVAQHLYMNGKEVKNLIIPNSVTTIARGAFYGCSGLTSVTIPNNVTSIGQATFFGCSGLTSVNIGNGITEIEGYVFEGCSSLTAVHIADLAAWCKIPFQSVNCNPLSFAHHLYMNGEEVKDIIIPDNVTNIGQYTFYGCDGLNSVTISYGVTNIGASAFEGCSNLASVIIPNSVTDISRGAFSGCSKLNSVVIGNGIAKISNTVFRNCASLLNVYCYAEQVPETHVSTFYDLENTNSIIQNATLHVPGSSIDAYSNALPWKDFGSIVALTDADPKPTGITEINNSEIYKIYYSLDGKRMVTPRKGVNIVKASDGKTRKVVVK